MQQQGDVLIKYIGDTYVSASLKSLDWFKKNQVKNTNQEIILAYGEATGHAHRIKCTDRQAKLYKDGDIFYLNVLSSVEVEHEEHHKQTIDRGWYTIGIVKEYDHLEEQTRRIAD